MKKTTLIILAMLILVVGIFAGCGQKDDKVVKIAHKNYTEQRLFGQIFSVLIEDKTDYETTVTEFGATMLCYTALKGEDTDVYPEFTGTGYASILGQTEQMDKEKLYDYVKSECEKRDGITWLKTLGYNNTYAISVTAETAQELGVTTISDLVPFADDLLLGCDNEFLGRADGLPAFKEAYGIEFGKEMPMDQGLTYAALRDGQIDVNVSYATDGRIAKYNLINLEDDLNSFLSYYLAPIMRIDYAEQNPEIVEALNLLDGAFTDEEMQQYNLSIDEGADPREVATQALKDIGLID